MRGNDNNNGNSSRIPTQRDYEAAWSDQHESTGDEIYAEPFHPITTEGAVVNAIYRQLSSLFSTPDNIFHKKYRGSGVDSFNLTPILQTFLKDLDSENIFQEINLTHNQGKTSINSYQLYESGSKNSEKIIIKSLEKLSSILEKVQQLTRNINANNLANASITALEITSTMKTNGQAAVLYNGIMQELITYNNLHIKENPSSKILNQYLKAIQGDVFPSTKQDQPLHREAGSVFELFTQFRESLSNPNPNLLEQRSLYAKLDKEIAKSTSAKDLNSCAHELFNLLKDYPKFSDSEKLPIHKELVGNLHTMYDKIHKRIQSRDVNIDHISADSKEPIYEHAYEAILPPNNNEKPSTKITLSSPNKGKNPFQDIKNNPFAKDIDSKNNPFISKGANPLNSNSKIR